MQLPAPANRGFMILFCRQSGEFAMQIGLIRAIDAHAPPLKLSGVFARDLPGATIRSKLAVASGPTVALEVTPNPALSPARPTRDRLFTWV